MKIKVVGSGYTWLNEPNTSFIINDEILFDTPQSFTKFFHMDLSRLKAIFITHFHSDHFTDLHLIVDFIIHAKKLKWKAKVFAPQGALEKLLKLYELLEVNITRDRILEYFDFIEVKDGQIIEFDKYKVEVVEVKHTTKEAYGYIFHEANNKKVIGFSGDTIQCKGLNKIIKDSDVIFIDTSATEKSNSHLQRKEVCALMQKHPNKTFYSVHVNIHLKDQYTQKLNMAKSGQVINVK